MTIALPDLNTLSITAVEQAHAYIAQKVAEYSPNVETKRGVLHDILFNLEAILQTAQDVYADNLRKSGSLLAASADPALANDAIIDQITSNFRTTRFPGAASSGKVVIVISQFIPSSVSSSNTFSASGKTFSPAGTFFGRTATSQIFSSYDSLIKPIGDGTFYYTITMTADAVGIDGNIKRNTLLTPSSPIPYFVTAYADSSFSSGSNYEDNTDLIKRLQAGISSKNMSNRYTISSMIREEEDFKSVLDVSSIGYGDAEQVRYHSLFPVASGNRLDVYVRSQDVPSTLKVTRDATLIGRKDGGGLWQVSILKTDLPGFYNIDKVLKSTVLDSDSQTSLTIDQDIRDYDLSGETIGFIPDITSPIEAAYSCYQTAVIRFIDNTTDPDLAYGSEESYDIYLRGMTKVRELQDFTSGRDVRPAAGDVLVKAPVPCDVKLSLVIYKNINDATIDTASIAKALSEKVNKLGFAGRLAASTLHSVIHSYISSTQTVGAVEMFGAIRRPDGTVKYIRNFDVLEIPSEPSRMVSPRTVAFILSADDVAITVKNIDNLTT